MRKVKYIVVAALLALTVSNATAQVRFDLGLDVLGGLGFLAEGSDPTAKSVLGSAVLPFPEFGVSYQFDLDFMRVGIGVRCFSLILISAGFPNIYAEIDLGNFEITGQLGGLYFFYFGLANGGWGGALAIPDLALHYKFSDNFKAGIGAAFFVDSRYYSQQTFFPFIWYIDAKFCWY